MEYNRLQEMWVGVGGWGVFRQGVLVFCFHFRCLEGNSFFDCFCCWFVGFLIFGGFFLLYFTVVGTCI